MTRRIIYPQKVEVPQVGDPITLDRWFQPISVPVRRVVVATAIVMGGAVAPLLPPVAPEVVTADKWYRPLNEPVPRPRFGTALQQTTARSFVFPTPEVITADKWFVPLVEPPRRPAFLTALQLATARSYVIAVPEVVTLDKWFQPWSQRLYTRPGAAPHLAPVTARGAVAPLPTDVKLSMWFEPLAEPVRAKPAIRTAAMQFWTGPHRIIVGPENVTMDKWFAALNRPVPGAAPRQFGYQYAVIGLVPVVPQVRHGGLSGSVDGSVNLAGDSSVSRVVLGGSTGAVRLSGRVTNS